MRYALCLDDTPVMHVVPDANHAGMWRVLSPDGTLSDMVNLTRAKDAAKSIAVRSLKLEEERVDRQRLHWHIEDAI